MNKLLIRLKGLNSDYSYPLFVYLLWRFVILIFQIFIQKKVFGFDTTSNYQKLYLNWITLWDSGHYLEVALKGYHYPNQAFFPFWPLVLKILSVSGVSIYKIDFILSSLLGLTVFILFYRLALRLTGLPYSRMALVLLAVFPTTFYLISGYSESLFLVEALTFFLLLERGKHFPASILGALATATRFSGIGLSVSFLTLKTGLLKRSFLFTVSLLGLFFYLVYLKTTFGDPFIFVKGVTEWGRFHWWSEALLPLLTLYKGGLEIINNPSGGSFRLWDFYLGLIFLILLPLVYKKLGLKYFLYSLALILIPLSSGKTESLSRYVLPVFPVFMAAGGLYRFRLVYFAVAAASFILQLYLLTRFLNYLWVA